MKSLFDLTGKRAFITGATHGLGMAMAKGLGDAGAQLIISGTNENRMDAALADYRQNGYKADGFIFDVTNESDAASAVDKAEADIGPIDILINNAGIIMRVP